MRRRDFFGSLIGGIAAIAAAPMGLAALKKPAPLEGLAFHKEAFSMVGAELPLPIEDYFYAGDAAMFTGGPLVLDRHYSVDFEFTDDELMLTGKEWNLQFEKHPFEINKFVSVMDGELNG